MRRGRAKRRGGFTLLEVMLAVAIMAISLAAVFSAEAGSVKMAHRARKLSFATLLARCKMGELEEDLMKKGLPAAETKDTDDCCKDAPISGFKCSTEIMPIVLPDTMFGGDEDEEGKGKKGGAKPGAAPGSGASPGTDSKDKGGLSGLLGAATAALGGGKEGEAEKASKDKDSKDKDGKDKDGKDKKPDQQEILSGDPSRLLAGGGGDVDGISAMAMQYVYPILKPSIQSQIRRVTVTVEWSEGSADKTFDLTQYFVAEQPVPLATDPNDPNGTGLGTGTGVGSTGTPSTSGAPRAFGSTP